MTKINDFLNFIKEESEFDMNKARGVPSGFSNQPPGPPPRPGLKWNSQTHRWISDKTETTKQKSLENTKIKPLADITKIKQNFAQELTNMREEEFKQFARTAAYLYPENHWKIDYIIHEFENRKEAKAWKN